MGWLDAGWDIAPNPPSALGYIYLPNGYALTDLGLTSAIADLLTAGGGIIDLGNMPYSFAGSVTITPTGGKPVHIIGKGIKQPLITQTADAPCFIVQGPLVQLSEIQMATSFGTPTTASVEITDAGATVSRVKLRRVQSAGFHDGLIIDPPHGFDQIWLEECLFNSHLQNGIWVKDPGSGCALLTLDRCQTDNNANHGTFIHTTSIIGHIAVKQLESVNNGGDMLRIEGTGTNTIASVVVDDCDLEQVQAGAGANSALHMIFVWKGSVKAGQFSAKTGATAFAGIQLENCRDVEVISPWIRRAGDGMGNCTNELYVVGASTQHITGSGFSYFGTALDWTIDGTVPTGTVVNQDNVVVLGRANNATSLSLAANVAVTAGGLDVTGGMALDGGGTKATGVLTVPATGGLGVGGVKVLALRTGSGSAQFDLTPQSLGARTAETPAFRVSGDTMTITGGFATQRFHFFRQPTVSAATSLTITDAATVAIEGAPLATGAGPAVLTRKYQLWLQGTDPMRYDATTGVGNGASGNVTSLAHGTGTGPANTQAVVGYIPVYTGTTQSWVPFMQ